MPAQRILSLVVLVILCAQAIGCGAQKERQPNISSGNSATDQASSGHSEEDTGKSVGQQVAELPDRSSNSGGSDITIPVRPFKKPDPLDDIRQSAGDVVEETPATDPYTDEALVMSPGATESEPAGENPPEKEASNPEPVVIAPPPPPMPRPAGAAPVTSDRNAAANPSSVAISGAKVIRREGATKDHKGFSSERVYFATNREPVSTSEATRDPDLFFGDERGDLTYGACEVSIPYKRVPGTLPEPSVLKLEFSQDPQKHVVLMEIERLPDAEYWKQLRARVEASPNRQLMVFIHGYCATFRDAARRTAQMAYDMNYQGPAMFFSWPAGSEHEAFQERANYLKDLRRAEESDEDLITVIESISRYSGAQRVHLVAHSMGNFVLTEALKTIDDRRRETETPPKYFDQVVMAAPDLNAKEFITPKSDRVRAYGRRFTVYASRHDKALKLSKTVNGFEPLGLLNDYSRQGAVAKLYELVDASTAKSSWFDSGHVYYGDMPEMLIDLAFVFRGLPASSLQRGLGETPPLFRLTSQSK